MSQTTQARPRVDDPFGGGMRFEPEAEQPRLLPAVQGTASDQATAQIITAQRVAFKRNMPDILREAKVLATAAAQKFYYSMPFKERGKDGGKDRTVHVEGPSIDCAMAALLIYGNCRVENFPARETTTHWTFMAQFVDYEKGVTVVRAFNQRKSQTTGIRDVERNLDIVFQIGQSKAIRNVIVSALKWLTDEMFDAAKSGVLRRIEDKPDQAREWLTDQFYQIGVDVSRVSRIVTRTVDKWNARDMAKLFAELSSVKDGFADADDLWPTSEGDALRREQENREADKHSESLEKDREFLDGGGQQTQQQDQKPADPKPEETKPATRTATRKQAAAKTPAPIENAPETGVTTDKPAPATSQEKPTESPLDQAERTLKEDDKPPVQQQEPSHLVQPTPKSDYPPPRQQQRPTSLFPQDDPDEPEVTFQ